MSGRRANRCLAKATSGCSGWASTYAMSCSRSRALPGSVSDINASIAVMACRRMSGIFFPSRGSTRLGDTRRRGDGAGPLRLGSGRENGLVDIWCPLFLFQLNLKRIHGHTRSQERALNAEDYKISLRRGLQLTPGP